MSPLKNISNFSIIVLFLCFSLVGIALVPLLPIKLEPSHSMQELSISFSMSESSARVVEMEVTSKLEAMLSRVSGVKSINSRSGSGWGRITIELDKHTSIDMARFEASTIIRQTWQELPQSVSYPHLSVRRSDANSSRPFINYTINSVVLPIVIQNYAENVIKAKLSDIKGIYSVEVVGATPMEWQLEYDALQLVSLGITVNDIKQAIQLHYHTEFLGMGETEDLNGNRSWMRVILSSDTDESIVNTSLISVKSKSGDLIRLSQLVKIQRVEQQPRSYYRINGLNSIYLSITAEESANQLELSSEIEEVMADVKSMLPPGYELYQSYNATDHIRAELNSIYLRSGLTIVILLLFVFFITRNTKYLSLIIMSLMVNLSISVIFYYFLDLEIQLYSLAGITISLNLIIDNTIIMSDHIMHNNNRKIFIPTLAATLTTLGALSIIFFLDERVRLNLQDFAAVVMINLFVSLLIALFFVPALIEKMHLKRCEIQCFIYKRFVVYFTRFYRQLITTFSRCKWVVYTLFILLFGTPIFMLPNKIDDDSCYANCYNKVFDSKLYKNHVRAITDIAFGGTLRLFVESIGSGRSSSSSRGETELKVYASMPNGTTLLQMNRLMITMERFLTTFPEIKQFQTSVSSANNASISIYFTKSAEDSSFPYQLENEIINKALELGGGSWSVRGVGLGFNNSAEEVAGELQIKLLGYNYDDLYDLADTLKSRLLSYRRIRDVEVKSDFSLYKGDYEEYFFDLNKSNLAVNQISPMKLFSALSNSFTKDLLVSSILVNGEKEQIKLTSKQSKLSDIWALRHVGVDVEGRNCKLSELATISKEQLPQDIVKVDQQYQLLVQFNYLGTQGRRIMKKEVEKLSKSLPMGYLVEGASSNFGWWGGQNSRQYWLLVLVVVILFFTTSVLFNSLRQPIVVILIIPVSFIGVFLTFYLFNLNFDQGGFTSFILLSGITVNASIYILNEYNNLRKQKTNLPPLSIYLKAWNSKIIPILLTVVSTILGFIPFLVGLDKESFWFALAAGSIGGLIVSIIGVFVLLPLMLIDDKN